MRDQQYELTDQQWVRLEPLLPPQRTGCRGRPCHPHRPMVEGIFWLARTGAPRRDVPERFGNWRTHFVDSTHVQAHQHAAGARRVHGGPEDQSLGRSRGGFGTKAHVRAEGGGKPLVLLLTSGQRHEQTVFETLMTGGTVRREDRGRPRRRPTRVVGDRGYSRRSVRQYLRTRAPPSLFPTVAMSAGVDRLRQPSTASAIGWSGVCTS
jgi:transposase